jgi:hypothetical protein
VVVHFPGEFPQFLLDDMEVLAEGVHFPMGGNGKGLEQIAAEILMS